MANTTFTSGELVTATKLNTINPSIISPGSTAARTLAVRAGDVINVKDYGATGGGSLDDFAAIKLALIAASEKRLAEGSTTVGVFFPDGVYVISEGIPLSKGIYLNCRTKHGAIIECNGSGAALYTATYSGGVFTDNLDAVVGDIQDKTKIVSNAGIGSLFFTHTGAITGNAPSGVAWDSVVQIVGAPTILLDGTRVSCTTNGINGIHIKYSWRAELNRPYANRGGAYSGGVGIYIDSTTNNCLVDHCFVFGAWDIGLRATNPDSITIIEPNVEFATVGIRVGGVRPRIIGGYLEGNATEIQLGLIGGASAHGYYIQRPWFNGSSATYGIYLANCSGEIDNPYFTGSYSASKFRSATIAEGNVGNLIRMHVSDPYSNPLAGLGLDDGRNIFIGQSKDYDDHRQLVSWDTGSSQHVEQNLNQRGAQFVAFSIRLTNTGGTLQVRIGTAKLLTSDYTDCFSSSSASITTLPDVDSGNGFGSVGAGRLVGSEDRIIFNTLANIASEAGFIVGSVRSNNGASISVDCENLSRDIDGATIVRPELHLRNATTDTVYSFNTTNFTSGQYMQIQMIGFIK